MGSKGSCYFYGDAAEQDKYLFRCDKKGIRLKDKGELLNFFMKHNTVDLANRFPGNPLLKPSDISPSVPDMHVACLLNPGVFQFKGMTWLLIRVAERAAERAGFVNFPMMDPSGKIQLMKVPLNHVGLIATDVRVHNFDGTDYLTTLSHLRLFCSEDGVNFHEPEGYAPLTGIGTLEAFGIEDCRVVCIENVYYLSFTSVSTAGVGVGLRTTRDWQHFNIHGMILPPHNKDCAIFEEKINGLFYALHRPSSVAIGGNYIWLAESPDGIHWGNHTCILKTRPMLWDNARVGAGAAPIKTAAGWLEIYHGANQQNQYCLGAFLMDLEHPSIVIGRTEAPIMVPSAPYEVNGFFGNVVFTNGHVLGADGDTLTLYYGAADEFVCGAWFSLKEILGALHAC